MNKPNLYKLPVATKINDLSHCEHCHEEMVYPIDWHQGNWNEKMGGYDWVVTLRCPNCEEQTDKLIQDENLISDFDYALDVGTDQMITDLRKLSYDNMSLMVNSFVKALELDLITADDFR